MPPQHLPPAQWVWKTQPPPTRHLLLGLTLEWVVRWPVEVKITLNKDPRSDCLQYSLGWLPVALRPLSPSSWHQACSSMGFHSHLGPSSLLSREGNGTPLQYSCLENPTDGGAWWAAVHGVAKSRTWLSNFTFTFHFHALEKEMATHSSVLAWRIPGMREVGRLPSMGLQSWTRLKRLSSSSSLLRVKSVRVKRLRENPWVWNAEGAMGLNTQKGRRERNKGTWVCARRCSGDGLGRAWSLFSRLWKRVHQSGFSRKTELLGINSYWCTDAYIYI